MNRRKQLMLSGATLSLVAILTLAAPQPASGPLSVGDFALLIAGHLQSTDKSQAPMTPEAARRTLQKAGIRVSEDLETPLTEAIAADWFGQVGITVQALHPSDPLDRERAEALVNVFGATLTSRSGQGAPAAPAAVAHPTNGVAPSVTPSLEDLSDCQLLGTKDCQFCCRDLLSGSASDLKVNRICGKACNTAARRQVSPSEPTP